MERDGCTEQRRAGIKEMEKEPGGVEKQREVVTGKEDGKGCERAGEKRETSSRGDLRSGAALSSLNILADLISPALFQR